MSRYFVRVGSLGEIYAATGPSGLVHRRRVLLRTERGVELGELVSPADRVAGPDEQQEPIRREARILRATRPEDELLLRRLARHKRQAIEACRDELADLGSSAILLDVDQLFDGNTLIMHFLGSVDEAAERVTREVAERYESIVRTRHFAKQLSDGCGPDCGSDGSGCGAAGSGCSGGCQGCGVSAARGPMKAE